MRETPQEIIDSTTKTNSAFKRVREAEAQVEEWKKELMIAKDEYHSSQAEHSDLLARWNPETGEIKPKNLRRFREPVKENAAAAG